MRGRAMIVIGAVALAWFGSGFHSHSRPATVAVLIAAAVILVLAVRRPSIEAERSSRLRRALILWAVLLAVGLVWEACAFVQQPDWTEPSYQHPTISTLFDPVLEQRPLKFIGWLIWLRIGWKLVHR